MEKIGIVTITYNSASVIEDFMSSILTQTHTDFVLYIVDNDSTDSTVSILSKYPDSRIKLLKQESNTGSAGGSNIGVRAAINDGLDYIMLLNNDTVFNENLLKTLLHELKSQNADAVTPKIMYHTPATKIWYAGGWFKSNFEFIIIHNGEGEEDVGQYNNSVLCDYAPTCCVLFTKSGFLHNGYFDEKFFVYSEDADWFYRAKKIGLKLLYAPIAVLYHKVSSLTGGSTSQFSAVYGTRNKVYLIRKNFYGLKKILYLMEYFGWVIVGFIIGRFSFKEFKWKIRAFFSGLFL